MSRYSLSPKPEFAHCEVFVGWDNPLGTFFLQVLDEQEEEGKKEIAWKGIRPNEITTIDQLKQLVEGFAELTPNIVTQLWDDWNGRTEPTPLQKFFRKNIEQLFDVGHNDY